jgi:hypothetical protein
MTKRLLVAGLLTAGLVLACADGAGPPLDDQRLQPVASADMFRPIKWQPAEGPVRFTVADGMPVGESQGAGDYAVFASPGIPVPPLDTYEASVWTEEGKGNSLSIDYIDQGSSKPDGEPLQKGDSVLITATVDTVAMAVRFGPAGLQFAGPNPPQLMMWYSGANGDLNGDGVVDETDDEIERKHLGMWYQEVEGADWERIKAKHSPNEDWLSAKVRHFSGFAIAY